MIIQRWQSVFLLIAFACMAAFTIWPLGQWQLADYSLIFRSWGIFSEGVPTDGAKAFAQPTVYLACVAGLTALLSLIDIFLFKNLRLQKRVCAMCVLLVIATGFQAALLGYTAIDGSSVSWSSLAFAPFISLVALILAWRGINADQKKISGADRLWS